MSKTLQRIICIDDEDDILQVACMCLETVGGYEVTPCHSGEEGIKKALEIVPDLIMIDVMMPGLDGPATLEKMRMHDTLDRIPIIFMTARVQPAEVEEYLQNGATSVVAKPFDPMTLAKEVQAIWGRIHK